jgi:hypothetical protein
VSLLLSASGTAHAYSVLTHEQLVDLSWKPTIVPILLSRYPSLTAAQLNRAHAYAYGGCAIQDLGYYPSGNKFFSNLTHYVRSGDFVQSLFRNARNANELAFAIGSLSHYFGDNIGHSQAINTAVALAFPNLRAKYGPSVSYAEGKTAHVRVEFAFDVNQITKQHLAPSRYLRSVGLDVPRGQLATAFYETYGLSIGEILGLYSTMLRIYRFGARSFLPAVAYAEALLHRGSFPPDIPGPDLDLYGRHVAQLAIEADWDHYRRKKPPLRTYMLAALIVILPKVGPIRMLSIKVPTPETERNFIASANVSTASLSGALEQFKTLHPIVITNRDLDTGGPVTPGSYSLTDETYAELLARLTKDPARRVPAGLKAEILSYYSDPSAPISTKRHRSQWTQVQGQLGLLARMPEIAEPK